jgi:hypothetical protein
MRNRLIICVLAINIGVYGTGVFAAEGPAKLTAVGLFGSFVGNSTGNTGPGLGLLFSWNAAPLVGVNWSLSDEIQRFGIFADWWVLDEPISQTPFKYWVGVGAFGGIASKDDDLDVDLGARLPLGIRFFPVKKIDIFLDLVPMLRFLPELDLAFAADIGLRVHF